MAVAIVTDSTATLPPWTVERHRITVVPLHVVIGSTAYDEGTELSPAQVAEALQESLPVNTSRPSPEEFVQVYEKAMADGAGEIVSIHLSGEMSGTFESAQMAARRCEIPVHTVDSRLIGMGTGFAVVAAARAIECGRTAVEAAAAAQRSAAETTALFYVDTLEYLRRGGRIGAAAALVGSALAMKPLLRLSDGRIVPLEKVRTKGRALARLEELAVRAADRRDVQVAVSHLASPASAAALAERLRSRIGRHRTPADDEAQLPDDEETRLPDDDIAIGEVGAVIGAHVGPGMLAVVIAPTPSRLWRADVPR